MTQFCEYIKESSLSRLLSHNDKHDCGALTAFRKYKGCGEEGDELYTDKEKKQRNQSLKAKLLRLGYGVTAVKGKYPEGGKTVSEDSYFVVDLKDTGNLERDIKKLGEEFEQDSVLFIPKGAVSGETQAYLIGTNKCANNWLGYGKINKFEKGKLGTSSPIYTTYVNGRPMIFEDGCSPICPPQNGMGKWGLAVVAKAHWSELDV